MPGMLDMGALQAGAAPLDQQAQLMTMLRQRAMQQAMGGGGGPRMMQPPQPPQDFTRPQQFPGMGNMGGMGAGKGGGLLSNSGQNGLFDTYGMFGSQGSLFGPSMAATSAWAPSAAEVGPFMSQMAAPAEASSIMQMLPFLFV